MSVLSYHTPVMLEESVDHLLTDLGGVYVDLTFGGGGHSRGIFERISPKGGKLLAFDRDSAAQQNMLNTSKLHLIHADFKYLRNFLRYFNIKKISGVLADLGISSHQIDTSHRGFSFRTDAPLDMRMAQRSLMSAQQVFQKYSRERLERMFGEYGQIRRGDVLARGVVAYRAKNDKKTYSTYDLVEVVKESFQLSSPSHKLLAQVFQAFRIEVNQEIDSLRKVLDQMSEILSPKARLCVICYHSLETLEVKRLLQSKDTNDVPLFKKICNLKPSQDEISKNGRARSAILRVLERR